MRWGVCRYKGHFPQASSHARVGEDLVGFTVIPWWARASEVLSLGAKLSERGRL
jgi:hypothetical protein